MIDPTNIVKDYSDEELEELFVFCVCVAGKTAKTIAPRVHKMAEMSKQKHKGLFRFIDMNRLGLPYYLHKLGIGCYSQKCTALWGAIDKFKNIQAIRKASVSDLESVSYIGPKTARFFYMAHTNSNNYAALDTHILKFLKDNGVQNVPKNTPRGNTYIRLEKEYLKLVPKPFTAAEFDNIVWNKYESKK